MIAAGSLALYGRVEFVDEWTVDDSQHQLTVHRQANRRADEGIRMDEIHRPIYWVNNPGRSVSKLIGIIIARFFSNKLVIRKLCFQSINEVLFNLYVSGRKNRTAVTLFLIFILEVDLFVGLRINSFTNNFSAFPLKKSR